MSKPNRPAPASELASAHEATAWHTLTAEGVLRLSGSDASAGLLTAEVQERTRQFGPNRFTAAQSEKTHLCSRRDSTSAVDDDTFPDRQSARGERPVAGDVRQPVGCGIRAGPHRQGC